MNGNEMINSVGNCSYCPLTKYPNNIMCYLCKIIRHPHPFQLIKSLNYFNIFCLEPSYEINHSHLSYSYKELQKNIHPDMNYTNAKILQTEATDCSSFVSEAYQIIKGDITRAEYLLNLSGIPPMDSSIKTDPQFLMNLYALREKIEGMNSSVELNRMRMTIEDNITKRKMDIGGCFMNKEYRKIQKILRDVKYNQSIMSHIDKKMNLI